MQTVGRKPDHDVADLNILSGNDSFALDNSHNEAGKIVVAIGIEAWHFGSLAPDKRASVVFAGFGDALDYFLRHSWLQFPSGEIVHKKHGRSALHSYVIDTMVDQVRTNRVVDFHLKSNLELRSNPVDAGNKDRIKIFAIDGVQPAESADLAEYPFGEGFMRQILDALLGFVGAVDIDAGIDVGDGCAFRYGIFSHKNRPVIALRGVVPDTL